MKVRKTPWNDNPWAGILSVLLFLGFGGAYGQWKAVSYETIVTHKLDAGKEGLYSSIPVCFPGQKQCLGITVNEKNSFPGREFDTILSMVGWHRDSLFGKEIDLTKPIRLNYGLAAINIQLYTRNVKNLILALREKDSVWLFKDIHLDDDGFQVPLSSFISTWDRTGGVPPDNETIGISKILLLYEPSAYSSYSEVIVGNIDLDEVNTVPGGKVFAWIDSLTGLPREDYTDMFNRYSQYYYELTKYRQEKYPAGKSNPVTFEDFGIHYGYLSGYVDFLPLGKADEHQLLERFIKRFSELYPYYGERKVDKKAVQQEIDMFFKNSYRSYPELLAKLAENFRKWYTDPHLNVIVPSTANNSEKKLKNGPLRLRRIGDDVVVAAVFSDAYKDSIQLGSKVVSLDGKPVGDAEDPNRLLFKAATDTLKIGLRSDGGLATRLFRIPYSTPTNVGKNFIPASGVDRVSDSVTVIRINKWDGEDYYKFLNVFYSQKNIKGLIIDLRGNGGGYSEDVVRSLSLFTDYSYSLGRCHYPWFDESIMVFPARKEFRCPADAKVIILTDNRTACASEIFLLGMKRRQRSFIMGDSPTAGAIASPTVFHFPSGLILQVHTCFRQFVFDHDQYTEGKGIEPDIWVSRTHVRDLIPYEDKSLKYALLMMNNEFGF